MIWENEQLLVITSYAAAPPISSCEILALCSSGVFLYFKSVSKDSYTRSSMVKYLVEGLGLVGIASEPSHDEYVVSEVVSLKKIEVDVLICSL